uniref:Ribosomal RNA-processing protein 43 n=1 Tax=Setaria digitata TaxID=48799 RepID=A0A915PUY3_9BILA
MTADLLKLCDPVAYYNQFLLESIYPDGRSISSFRPILLRMGISGSSAGSSFARQGGATITCNIEALLAPVSDAPILVPVIQAAPNIPKNLVEDAVVMVNQLIAQDAFCTRNTLKTAGGRLTWILNLHIMILNVDGAISDALCTCIAGALVDLQLPEASTDCDEDIPIDINKVKLSETFHHIEVADIPVSSTFIVYKSPNEEVKILCDPVSELFRIVPNTVMIVAGNNARIHRISQSGICGDEAVMRHMVGMAIGRQKIVAESMLKAKEAHLMREKR